MPLQCLPLPAGALWSNPPVHGARIVSEVRGVGRSPSALLNQKSWDAWSSAPCVACTPCVTRWLQADANLHSIHMRSIQWVQVVGNEDMFTEWKGEMEMMAG